MSKGLDLGSAEGLAIVAGIIVGGVVIYNLVTSAAKAAPNAAAQAGSNLYDALGLTSLDNAINGALGLPQETPGQSSYTTPPSTTVNGLRGLGSYLVTLPSGNIITVPKSSVSVQGIFNAAGNAYQLYKDGGALVALLL